MRHFSFFPQLPGCRTFWRYNVDVSKDVQDRALATLRDAVECIIILCRAERRPVPGIAVARVEGPSDSDDSVGGQISPPLEEGDEDNGARPPPAKRSRTKVDSNLGKLNFVHAPS